MVKFIKENGIIFSIARDSESAFYMWKIAKELNHTVEINNVNYGNDWKARVEIEKLFGVSYSLNVC
jgi:hypothetical protein